VAKAPIFTRRLDIMATLAQRLKVGIVVSPTPGEGQDVINGVSRDN
jgi:hypothetical protein